MDLPASSTSPLSSKNFSTIARRLLLEQGRDGTEGPAMHAQDILNSSTSHSSEPLVLIPQQNSENKEVFDEMDAELLSDDYESSASPAEEREVTLWPGSEEKPRSTSSKQPAMNAAGQENTDLLGERLRAIRPEDLKAPLEELYEVAGSGKMDIVRRQFLGRSGKVVITRVRRFFEELKKLLGKPCNGTILAATVTLTALACGVSTKTVKRAGLKYKFTQELSPPRKEKDALEKEDDMEEATLRKYGLEWGPIVKWFIREKLKKDKMTINALHKEMCEAYADFPMSESTLRRFVKAIGVTCGRDRGISYMIV